MSVQQGQGIPAWDSSMAWDAARREVSTRGWVSLMEGFEGWEGGKSIKNGKKCVLGRWDGMGFGPKRNFIKTASATDTVWGRHIRITIRIGNKIRVG